MKIIKFNSQRDITVQFDNGYIVQKTHYDQFRKGSLSCPYDKTVRGVGYIGEGKYKTHINKKQTKEYMRWVKMMQRCYDENIQNKFPTYIGCTVCKEWHNFQIFAKWYEENHYEVVDQRMELDKDILIKGNKIYSPETCCIVPSYINTLFVKNDLDRGMYPIGVQYDKRKGRIKRFRATLFHKTIGFYFTPNEAFEVYKKHKEVLIKETAEKYKEYIPEKLYKVMYNYQVEITD